MKAVVFHIEQDLYDVYRDQGLSEYLDEMVHDFRQLGATHFFVVDLSTNQRVQEWQNHDSLIEKEVYTDVMDIYNKYQVPFVILENQQTLDNNQVTDYETLDSYIAPNEYILVTAPDLSSIDLVPIFKGMDRVTFLNISEVPTVFSISALLITLYQINK